MDAEFLEQRIVEEKVPVAHPEREGRLDVAAFDFDGT
jgi:hypothetical protein